MRRGRGRAEETAAAAARGFKPALQPGRPALPADVSEDANDGAHLGAQEVLAFEKHLRVQLHVVAVGSALTDTFDVVKSVVQEGPKDKFGHVHAHFEGLSGARKHELGVGGGGGGEGCRLRISATTYFHQRFQIDAERLFALRLRPRPLDGQGHILRRLGWTGSR